MTQVIIEDLDPVVLEKLEALAKEHGRSLQEELKSLLEAAVQIQTLNKPDAIEVAKKKAARMRQQLTSHAGSDNAEFQPLDRERDLSTAIERLRKLRKISGSELSLREMREEGRRF